MYQALIITQLNPESPSPSPIPQTRQYHRLMKQMVVQSVTNQEIAYYWQRRRMVEEDHLYAAIKAAARLRARNLSDYDYLQFQDSLKEDYEGMENKNTSKSIGGKDDNKEIRVGIKDWWTKSNYAYLNQPAMKFSENPKRRHYYTYLPQFFTYNSA